MKKFCIQGPEERAEDEHGATDPPPDKIGHAERAFYFELHGGGLFSIRFSLLHVSVICMFRLLELAHCGGVFFLANGPTPLHHAATHASAFRAGIHKKK